MSFITALQAVVWKPQTCSSVSQQTTDCGYFQKSHSGCSAVIQLMFHSATSGRPTTRNDCVLARRHRRRGGVSFPACRGSTWLCAGGSTAVVLGIPRQRLCQAKSPSEPLLEGPPSSFSALQFHNKHSWHSTRRRIRETKWFSIIYSSLETAYSSSPDYREASWHMVIHTEQKQYMMLS